MKTFTYELLKITYSREVIKGEEVQILTFEGKITHQNSDQVGDDLEEIFDESLPNVIIDLSQLEYINSIGLAVILSLVRKVEDLNGKFAVGGRHKLVETIVKLLEVSEHVRVFSSLDQARELW
ncbi:MAG: STAS domain-containing protein [Leptospiraceae bacterium]|nr:STAS domain-containing protein [Leptospiraceae bacterium]